MLKSAADKEIKILLIDDEKAIAETMIAYAKREGMPVVYAQNGQDGLTYFSQQHFDVIVLDWMLPGISGPEIIKRIREKSSVPILMISARDDESDVVIGLEYGADDYLTKPFGPRELMARIKSLVRRANFQEEERQDWEGGDLKVLFNKREVYKKDKLISLTLHEFRILEILINRKGEVVTREQLMEEALGYKDFLSDRTLDTHIKNLRRKIEDNSNPKYIITIRGLGFKFADNL